MCLQVHGELQAYKSEQTPKTVIQVIDQCHPQFKGWNLPNYHRRNNETQNSILFFNAQTTMKISSPWFFCWGQYQKRHIQVLCSRSVKRLSYSIGTFWIQTCIFWILVASYILVKVIIPILPTNYSLPLELGNTFDSKWIVLSYEEKEIRHGELRTIGLYFRRLWWSSWKILCISMLLRFVIHLVYGITHLQTQTTTEKIHVPRTHN